MPASNLGQDNRFRINAFRYTGFPDGIYDMTTVKDISTNELELAVVGTD